MNSVDIVTGEIVPVAPTAPNALAITSYLEQARQWLATAVEQTGPEQIAMAKAEIATAAEATKQLNLSKEIQLDAQEMVRRAEYALGKAIRKGQAEGSVTQSVRVTGGGPTRRVQNMNSSSPVEFIPHGQDRADIYQMVDNAATDEEFDDALAEAKAEGNLSRANVVRKVRVNKSSEGRDERAELIADLAAEGYRTQQIAPKVGITEDAVRRICRDYGITVRADAVVGRARRLDSNRILSGAVESLEVTAFSLQQVNPLDLDQEAAQEWIDSLTESVSAIRKAIRTIKESLHE